MLNQIFSGIFDSATTTSISIYQFLLCIIVALILGIIIAMVYGKSEETTRSYLLTVAVLPALVAVVIMLVNGNIGAGVAVAGAFSLIRFRSAPGSAKEIATIFLAMAVGLTIGIGYLGFAAVLTLVMIIAMTVLSSWGFGMKETPEMELRITVPEDLNFADAFDDILETYTSSYKLDAVKTSNMGSLFKLRYSVILKDENRQKDMLDELRTRNGNLEIGLSVKTAPVAGGEQL